MHPQFELLGEIGQNAYGHVYRAYDRNLKRNVAIMEIHDAFRAETKRMDPIWNQVLQLASLQHDHIVPVLDVDKGCNWIVMELMQGSLDDRLRKGPVASDIVRTVLRDGLDALQFLHANGTLHGDIRPQTLLVSSHGRTKLSFSVGLALCGEIPYQLRSQKYFAPELLDSNFGDVGPKLDLYCLGFAALELLMGSRLDKQVERGGGDPEMAWARWHASPSEEALSARELVPGIPVDLSNVIDKMLIKRVSGRAETAEELLRELEDRPPESVLSEDEMPAEEASETPLLQATAATESSPPPKFGHDLKSPEKAAAIARKPTGNKHTTDAKGHNTGSRKKGSSWRPPDKAKSKSVLDKPYVLYPLCAVLFTIIGLAIIWFTTDDLVTVTIVTDPAGCALLVGDKPLTPTESNTYRLPLGRYKVTAKLEGYETTEEEVSVTNEEREFEIKLESVAPEILVTINSAPPGAAIYIDGRLQEEKTTPAEIPLENGTHDIKLVKKGFVPSNIHTVEIAEDGALAPPAINHTFAIIVAIRTEPEGGKIFEGEDELKPTSSGEYELSPGSHKLTARLDGFNVKEQEIRVTEEDRVFGLPLVPIDPPMTDTGTIVVESVPAGADISVDGELQGDGKTPTNLPLEPGTHEIVLTRKGYLPSSVYKVEIVESAEPQPSTINHTFLMSVTIDTDPEGAEILEGQNVLKPNSSGKYELTPGQHKLTIRSNGFKTKEATLEVSESQNEFDIALMPEKRKWPLPDGLAPKPGTEFDSTLNLPHRIMVTALDDVAPMELALVKPGTFTFGVVDKERFAGELPGEERAMERPYYISLAEVTQAQYSAFAEAAGEERAGTAWKDGFDAGPQGAKLPVVNVSVANAQKFCKWVGGRLPREVEWEYAARGPEGKGFPHPWASASRNKDLCNIFFGGDAARVAVDDLQRGGTPVGLLHMLGNVAEWCDDEYRPGHGESADNPDLVGKHVVRGCSFLKSDGPEVRVTWRAPESPEGLKDIGFRVAAEVLKIGKMDPPDERK